MPLTELAIGPGTWLLLVTCGAVCGVDAVSWPQLMLSRPLVAGTLGGTLLGDPAAGFMCGAILELLALAHPPYGAATYPDTGPAGVVAGAGYAAAGGSGLAALVVALLAGWAIGWLGARSVHLLRRINEGLLKPVEALAGEPARLERRHRTAIALDALRAGLITGGFALPTAIATRLAAGSSLAPTAVAATAALLVVAVSGSAGSGARTLSASLHAWHLLLLGAAVAWVVGRAY
ncbi:MAG: PTS sugar transporter subunit IIC [Gemmatimonadota bacterium]